MVSLLYISASLFGATLTDCLVRLRALVPCDTVIVGFAGRSLQSTTVRVDAMQHDNLDHRFQPEVF